MPRRLVTTVTTALAVVATAIAVAPDSGAAPARTPLFQASAVGTAATLVGGAVTTSPSAPTVIKTRSSTVRNDNSVASVGVPSVLSTGAVSSDSSTRVGPNGNGTVVTGHARTAGVNLLAGVVTIAAIDTTAALTVRNAGVIGSARTVFTGLRISGRPVINGQVDPDTTIEVPGVAKIVLNASGVVPGSTSGMAVATGIAVTVLGGTFAGSTIIVNGANAQTARVGAGYAPLGGFALGAQVSVVGGDSTGTVGPLGAIGMPDVGTGGETLSNSLAAADLGAGGTAATLRTTANGTVSDTASRSTMTARVTGLSLLGGLVTANALTATASVRVAAGSAPVPTTSTTFTGLRVAGIPVPLDATPGLLIPLPGVGFVAIRTEGTTATAAAAAALVITLDTAAFGLPAGASIQVGLAYASLTQV